MLADDATARRVLEAIGLYLANEGAAPIPRWVLGPMPANYEGELGVTRATE